MYSFDFKAKLNRLNAQLFIDDEHKVHIHGDHFSSAICLRKGKRSYRTQGLEQLSAEAQQYLRDYDAGLTPNFICGVRHSWVPEYDQFEFETEKDGSVKSRFVARGWRSALMILAQRGAINIEKARKVFNCPGLGLDAYDRLDRQQKLNWAAEVA